MARIKVATAYYCEHCKDKYRGRGNHICPQSLILNGKTFYYDCTRKHEHRVECLTSDMIDALSEIVYADAK